MNRFRSGAIVALIVSCASALEAQDTAGDLTVRRTATDSIVLSAASIAALPRVSVRSTEHGKAAAFGGVSLQSVLAAAGIRLDSLRGKALADVVLIEARDGYRVAFTLGELATDLGGRVVVLADQRDGKPLSPTEGPRRLVVPADGRAARWVRQVRSITRVQLVERAP